MALAALAGAVVATVLVRSQRDDRDRAHIRFLLQGEVQGVKMRRYVEAAARYFQVAGFCINTTCGDVFGEAIGPVAKMTKFECWLRGEWRAVYTDLKPTPVGTAYPSRARVDRVVVFRITKVLPLPFSPTAQFAMVRDTQEAVKLEKSNFQSTKWKDGQVQADGWPAIVSRSVTASGSTVYESESAVEEYLDFHFQAVDSDGQKYFPYDDDVLPTSIVDNRLGGFATRCADICSQFAVQNKIALGRALDVGCAVGASSFELSKTYSEVVGLDFSHAFIDAAKQISKTGVIKNRRRIEGPMLFFVF